MQHMQEAKLVWYDPSLISKSLPKTPASLSKFSYLQDSIPLPHNPLLHNRTLERRLFSPFYPIRKLPHKMDASS
jgi:hypothetical protein